MKTITLHNKTFEVFIPETEIAAIVHSMANNINEARIKDPLIYFCIKWFFYVFSDIMKKITLPNTEISFVKLSSYRGTETTGEVSELIGLNQDLKGRNVIILEDIIDTGITLEKIISLLEKEEVCRYKSGYITL